MGEGWRKKIVREVGIEIYTLLYLKWIANRDPLIAQGTMRNVIGSLDGREMWGRMNTCICMAESLSCAPDTITILLIGYMPIKIKSLNSK